MKNLYDLEKAVAQLAGNCIAPLLKSPRNAALKTVKGKQQALTLIAEEFKVSPGKPTVWFNIPTLRSFRIARPVTERLKDKCNIILTADSSEVYDALIASEKRLPFIFYLPWDTEENALKFLDIVRPTVAVFIENDFPANYLKALKAQNIPAYLLAADAHGLSHTKGHAPVSARRMADTFEKIFTLDKSSAEKLKEKGVAQAESGGNPLFDNAMSIAMEPYTNEVVERFKFNKPLFIAGNVHLDNDMEHIERLVKEFTDMQFLIVPNVISAKSVSDIKKRLGLNIPAFSECVETLVIPPANALILDYRGDLSRLYRYADFVYVGGGFAKSLHSLIEPVVYGLPVAFGPDTKNNALADVLEESGVGEKFTTYPQLRMWISALKTDPAKRQEIKNKAQKLFEQNTGAADFLAREILAGSKR